MQLFLDLSELTTSYASATRVSNDNICMVLSVFSAVWRRSPSEGATVLHATERLWHDVLRQQHATSQDGRLQRAALRRRFDLSLSECLTGYQKRDIVFYRTRSGSKPGPVVLLIHVIRVQSPFATLITFVINITKQVAYNQKKLLSMLIYTLAISNTWANQSLVRPIDCWPTNQIVGWALAGHSPPSSTSCPFACIMCHFIIKLPTLCFVSQTIWSFSM